MAPYLLSCADQLAVNEFVHAILAEFAADAGALDAAERQLGRGAGCLVDVHHAGVQSAGDRLGFGGVSGLDDGLKYIAQHIATMNQRKSQNQPPRPQSVRTSVNS